jgi:multimeric flavodoxin WrbA
MKALVLDGSLVNDPTGGRVSEALLEGLGVQGWGIEHVLLREKKIHSCNGDFFCWTKHPGKCMYDDDNRDIARSLIHSDVVVYLTPVTFGGYSSTLKRFVDHQIQNISPFFTRRNGETHHKPRYEKYPDTLAVGWLEEPDPRAESVFHNLVYRNYWNFYASKAISGILYSYQSDSEIRSHVEQWLKRVGNAYPVEIPHHPLVTMISGSETARTTGSIKKALLMVGSPRNEKSTSGSLGEYFLSHLSSYGIEAETLYIHKFIDTARKQDELVQSVNSSDLVILSFPLYVDTLPAPVMKSLEIIYDERKNRKIEREQLFLSIANCGFPEPGHNVNALAVCELFAQKAGFRWAGGLSLGGGGMIHGVPLQQMDGRAASVRKALELAARAAELGSPVPEEAQRLMTRPAIPHWLYRLFGRINWKSQARKHGAHRVLGRRTYAAP